MNKEEALNDFLKGLRIVLNNASAYSKEHPYFIESVNNFKNKIETLFGFLSPIKINIAASSLFMDGKYLEKAMLYVDLATMFHLRKIKGVEFRQGLTTEELLDFLSSISLPVKEILRHGGIQNILNKASNTHLSIEILDYSELLQDGGEETKDIWVYLFRAAVQNEDIVKIQAFADNFESIIGKFKAKDLYEDEELRQNISNFLAYLKETQKDKLNNCTKALLRLFLRDKNIPQAEKIEKIKGFFKDLDNEDLTDALIDAISKDDDFNNLSFVVLSHIFDEDRHKQVACVLENKIKNTALLKNSHKIRKKIKDLFSVSESTYILPLYRQALSWIAEGSISENQLSFDIDLLEINYHFLLVNLLTQEQNPKILNLVSESLSKEYDKIIAESNPEYLRFLLETLDKKIQENAGLSSALEALQDRILKFIENLFFEQENLINFSCLVDVLKKSALGPSFYSKEIFEERKVNIYVLGLYFKLFPKTMPLFYEDLERKKSDIDFMAKIIKSLEQIESPLSLESLKRIFNFSNNLIKIEVLKSMQGLSNYDEEFLFSVLKKEDILLKKQALLILSKNDKARKIALEALFSIPNPFGRKNKIIMENLMAIEDIELKEAEDYLLSLSKEKFIWHRKIRDKALGILKKWHDRKN